MIKKYLFILFKVIACYLIAAMVLMLYIAWPNLNGHPHVPFSGFPAVLIISPYAPIALLDNNSETTLAEYAVFAGTWITTLLWIFYRQLKQVVKNKNPPH